ncbi:MAG: hypothetical protein ACJAWP_000508 [Porticoccus sp.]|jgi:hypothetical protein
MAGTYRYANSRAKEETASGVSGVLCKDSEGDYFFRVYHSDKSFTDYELCHDDLPVTIAQDALASFYRLKDHNVLDHSPQVLGLERE